MNDPEFTILQIEEQQGYSVEEEVLRQLDYWIDWLKLFGEPDNPDVPKMRILIRARALEYQLRPEIRVLEKCRSNFRRRASLPTRGVDGKIWNKAPRECDYKPVNLPKAKPGELDPYRV